VAARESRQAIMSRTALIFGALGQDGRLLAKRLSAAATTVVGVVRPGSVADTVAPHRLIELDVADTDAVGALVEQQRPDQIFYLAAVHHSAEAAPTDRLALWPAMARTNCLGVVNTIRAVLRYRPDCKLIFAASSQMYMAADGDLSVDEATPCQPRTFYGETKAWSMEAVRFARAQEGLRGGTAILFNHESPLRSPSFISRKITRAAAAIKLGQEQRLTVANLHGRADWSSAEDVVDALMRMGNMDVPADYVIGSGQLRTVEQMLDCAFRHVGLTWRDHVDSGEPRAAPAVYADTTRIQTELAWKPAHDFETWIRAMVDSDLSTLRHATA
jgi:GDPmannose 4,6-dehydratase